MTNIRISVVSDVVCPWCYIGHRRMQQAQKQWLTTHPQDTFTVRYEPFQLNPAAPRPGVDKHQMYIEKFGEARLRMMRPHMAATGREVGINFQFGGLVGNTRDSHRLIHLAQRLAAEAPAGQTDEAGDIGSRTVEALFAAYHEQEKDISNVDTLREIATAAGVPADTFQKSIVDSDGEGREVDEALKRARMMGISGVPFFTIQDKFHLSGGQPPEEFLSLFERVAKTG
jgi:predicted DsbA family dithiol-disulfide isomerase